MGALVWQKGIKIDHQFEEQKSKEDDIMGGKQLETKRRESKAKDKQNSKTSQKEGKQVGKRES